MRPVLLAAVAVFSSPNPVTSKPAPGESHGSAAREVEVVGFDYAFRAPTELPPGRTVFRFVNRGKVRHEFNVLLLAPGITIDQLNTIVDPDRPRDVASLATLDRMIEATVGVLMAGPGEHSAATLVTDLLPGRTYAIRCIAHDSVTAPAHFTLGMYSALHVRNGTRSPPPATARVDTIVATDYAFQYPRTMSPGAHTLAFVNAGRQRHMALMALLRPGASTSQVVDLAKARKDPNEIFATLFERAEGVLHSFAGKPHPLGVLQLNLLPGRDYAVICFIPDSATAPPHFMLGMSGTIHVAAP